MELLHFQKGIKFKYKKQKYRVLRKVKDDSWQCEHTKSGQLYVIEDNKLRIFYAKGKLKFCGMYIGKLGREIHFTEPELATDEQLKLAKRKVELVERIIDLPNTISLIEKELEKIRNEVKGTDRLPGARTLLRWKKNYEDHGKNLRVFIPRHKDKGNRKSRYCEKVNDIVDEIIEKKYLSLERPSVENILIRMKAKIRKYNKGARTKGKKELPEPTRRLVKRRLERIPAYDKYASRHGWVKAQNKFRTTKKHSVAEAPLQSAEIDHTKLNMFVLDDDTLLPLGRPWFTVCIDSYSRVILGIYISFEPPSFLSVSGCLKNAFLPKDDLRKKYPNIKNEWSAHGVMEQLVIDNGLEFLGTSLENVCISSNVHIVKCPRKKPWYKGKVERFYKTLDDSLTLATPGTTFRNIFDKGDYDPKKHAVVRYSTLKMCIHKWIADVYHQKIHSSLQAKPIDVWNSSIKPENIPLPTSIEELNAILGRSVTRSLSQTGIQVDKLLYNSDELRNLRLKYGTKFDVEVRVDDTDIGRIRVICPKTHRIYTAEAINFDYADGLSSFMHKTIRAGTKAKIGSDDIEAWIDELAEIQQVIDDEVGFKNNNKGVNRARLKESKATSKSPKKGNVSEGHRSEKNRKKETKKNSENLRPSNEHKYRSIEVTDR